MVSRTVALQIAEERDDLIEAIVGMLDGFETGMREWSVELAKLRERFAVAKAQLTPVGPDVDLVEQRDQAVAERDVLRVSLAAEREMVSKLGQDLATSKHQNAKLRTELEEAVITKRSLLRRAFAAGARWEEATVTPPIDSRTDDEAFEAFYAEVSR